MKTVSADKTYIDYMTDNEGIRVWKDGFQLICESSEGEWVPQDRRHNIPAKEEDLSWMFVPLRPGQAPPKNSPVATVVARYTRDEEDPELEEVLRGTKTFEEAVSG
jgi:hypothetical protein